MVDTSPGPLTADPRTEPRRTPAPSRLLAGRYRIGQAIGRGGMADVHIGTDTRLDRRVAIKLLRPSLATEPRFRTLFREEAQKAARMAHPTIVRVFDAGEETVLDPEGVEHQVPYIVMEYVDGRLLKDIVAEGPLEPKEAARIIGQVLTALEYSHRALLVHRDIKPGNIMVTPSGQVKVMDFGIARAVSDNSATVAETGTVLGTAQYFSPEQARGETVDARTDLYSTGVVLFELLTGRAPFRGERPAAVAYQHISEAPVPPSSIDPRVSPAMDSVVLHALRKSKLERFQTAAEFRADVQTAAAGEVPVHRDAAPDFTSTLFGSGPSVAAPEATMRQLAAVDDERVVRTQSRPPVAWIWAGILLIIAILLAVVIFVAGLANQSSEIGERLSVEVPNVTGAQYEDGQRALDEAGLISTRLNQTSDTVPEGVIIDTDPQAGQNVAREQNIRVYVSVGKTATNVPVLEQLAEADAIAAIQRQNLVHGTSTPSFSATVPAGVVISSTPRSGEPVQEGDTVDLVVSNGQVEVPDFAGQPFNTASSVLVDELNLTVVPVPDAGCSGQIVTAQSVPAGPVEQGSEIRLTYCSAP